MCIFNRPVLKVAGTKIFVSRTCDNRQLTIYQNYVTAHFDPSSKGRENKAHLQKALQQIEQQTKGSDSNAMILPFPAGKVDLVDLSAYPTLFVDCKNCFPVSETIKLKTRGRKKKNSSHLEVLSCGSYNVSIAPTLEDLSRIDPSVFTLADNVGKLLEKHYDQGFGFLVCCFKENGEKHPLGYIHSPLPDSSGKHPDGLLFVPTRHEHGGHGDEGEADWDHEIYSVNTLDSEQAGQSIEEVREDLEKKKTLQQEIVVKNQLENVLKKLPVQLVKVDMFRRKTIVGEHENKDLLFADITKEKEGLKPEVKIQGSHS